MGASLVRPGSFTVAFTPLAFHFGLPFLSRGPQHVPCQRRGSSPSSRMRDLQFVAHGPAVLLLTVSPPRPVFPLPAISQLIRLWDGGWLGESTSSPVYLCLYIFDPLWSICVLIISVFTVSIHMYIYEHKARAVESEIGYANMDSSLVTTGNLIPGEVLLESKLIH